MIREPSIGESGIPLSGLRNRLSVQLHRRRALLFVLPAVLVVLLVTIFPLIYALAVSLVSWNMQIVGDTWEFNGLNNYINALKDTRFQLGFKHTLEIGLPALILEILLGLGLAMLLNRRIPGRGVIIGLLVTPVLIAPAAVAMMWRLILGEQYGAVNGFLEFVLGITTRPDWLGNPDLARWAIVLVDVWQWTPFVMLILLAGLATIPDELYEAAKVDGATGLQSFWHITLPLLRLPILIVFLMRLIDMIKLFDFIYIMTEGGPGSSTETATFYTYAVGLRFLRIGDGAAMSFIIVFVTTIIVTLLFRVTRFNREEPA